MVGAYVVSMELEYSGDMGLAVFPRVLLVLPYLGRAIDRKTIKTAVNVGQDVLEGKSVKQAVASRGRQAVNDLAKRVWIVSNAKLGEVLRESAPISPDNQNV